MNFELNIRPHFEFFLIALCLYIRVMTFGIVRLSPKGIDAFNDNSCRFGYGFGKLAGFATFAYISYLYVTSFSPR